MTTPSRARGLNGALRDDTGFALMELIVAMMIIGGSLVGLLALQVSSANVSQTSRERQQATALANQVLERMRSLPATEVRKGLDSADLAANSPDVNISGGRLSFSGVPAGETLVTTSGLNPSAPLKPYVQPSTTLDGRGYNVRVYVTTSSVGSDGYWLSAIVRWSSRGRSPAPILVRSFDYAPAAATS